MGVGVRKCEQHGIEFTDWKCMYCCSVASYCCWGTNYFCGPCHDIINRIYPNPPPAQDCNGVDCPLGVPHPPAAKTLEHTEGGAFPLGCSICRNEKYEKLKNLEIKQVNTSAENMPKSFISKRRRFDYHSNVDDIEDKIDRPLVEIELPDFIVKAEEILEAEIEKALEAERERIRILNKTPVSVLGPR